MRKIAKINEFNSWEEKKENLDKIIKELIDLDIDGESMQYILVETGMDYQMLSQLIMTMPFEEVNQKYEERLELDGFNEGPYGKRYTTSTTLEK